MPEIKQGDQIELTYKSGVKLRTAVMKTTEETFSFREDGGLKTVSRDTTKIEGVEVFNLIPSTEAYSLKVS